MQDLSLHLLDIMQNSVSAKARKITVSIDTTGVSGMLTIAIGDDGKGMNEDFLRRATDPFTTTRTVRKVGLGLPLFKTSAELSGGGIRVASQPGKGTMVTAGFGIDNIDRPPLGDIGETIAGMILAEPDIRYVLKLKSIKGDFSFDTSVIAGELGEVPINETEVLTWIKEYINEGVKTIFGGVLNEIPG